MRWCSVRRSVTSRGMARCREKCSVRLFSVMLAFLFLFGQFMSGTNLAAETSATASQKVPKVFVKGLFNGAAVLEIDGRQTMLKVGKMSTEGVKLVSATSKQAVVEIDGQRRALGLSQSIGTSYTDADRREVRLQSQHQGHYFGSARINGRAIQFLVDTGASTISMSSVTATRLGIRYKRGRVVRVSTAQGTTKGFHIKLARVEVGGLRVNNVAAIVIEGEYPLDVLLGNSFLSQIDMNIENGVLILRSKF